MLGYDGSARENDNVQSRTMAMAINIMSAWW